MAVIADEAEAVAPQDATDSVEALPLKTAEALEASVKTTPREATAAEAAAASTVVATAAATAAAEMAVASSVVATVAAATVVVEAIVEAAATEAIAEVVDKELLDALMTVVTADSETLGVIMQPVGEPLSHYTAPAI